MSLGSRQEQLKELASYVQQVAEASYLTDATGPLAWEAVNLYAINSAVVKPLTEPFQCSWVELVASKKQPPSWFVSHWWGTPFVQSKALLEFHSQQRSWPGASGASCGCLADSSCCFGGWRMRPIGASSFLGAF